MEQALTSTTKISWIILLIIVALRAALSFCFSFKYSMTDHNSTIATHDTEDIPSKRPICSHCHRPTPQACLCPALPTQLIQLQRCRCFVLQHPHEKRRKNASIPLVEMVLHPDSLQVRVAWRLGPSVSLPSSSTCWLVYPDPQAIPVEQALQRHYQHSWDCLATHCVDFLVFRGHHGRRTSFGSLWPRGSRRRET